MKQENKVKIIEWIKRLLRFEDSSEYIKIETQTAKPIIFRVSEVTNGYEYMPHVRNNLVYRLLKEVGNSKLVNFTTKEDVQGIKRTEAELWVFKKEE